MKHIICKNCGKPAVQSGLCEECACYLYCEGCDRYRRTLSETNNGLRCSDCIENYHRCIDCGELIHISDGFLCCGKFICYDCNGMRFSLCEACGHIFPIEDMVEYDDCYYCQEHLPRNAYPTRECGKPIQSNSFEILKSRRRFGIEIETDRGDYGEVPEYWGIHYDGSIDGMELVSPILQGDTGLEEIKWLYDNCNLEFDYKCGIHIHIDVTDLNNIQRMDLIKAFIDTKEAWFDFVNEERQDNEYCGDTLPEVEWHDNFNSYMHKVTSRYSWLNLRAFSRHNTFELRLLEGCDYKKVKEWLKRILNFVEEVVNMHKIT